jgi:hypothetical protein
VIAAETYTEREWQRRMMMDIWCLTADEYASALERFGPPVKAAEVRRLASGAYNEIKEGSYYSNTIRVAVGRHVDGINVE